MSYYVDKVSPLKVVTNGHCFILVFQTFTAKSLEPSNQRNKLYKIIVNLKIITFYLLLCTMNKFLHPPQIGLFVVVFGGRKLSWIDFNELVYTTQADRFLLAMFSLFKSWRGVELFIARKHPDLPVIK